MLNYEMPFNKIPIYIRYNLYITIPSFIILLIYLLNHDLELEGFGIMFGWIIITAFLVGLIVGLVSRLKYQVTPSQMVKNSLLAFILSPLFALGMVIIIRFIVHL